MLGDTVAFEMFTVVHGMQRAGQVLRIFEQLAFEIEKIKQQVARASLFDLGRFQAVPQIIGAQRFQGIGFKANVRQAKRLRVFGTRI